MDKSRCQITSRLHEPDISRPRLHCGEGRRARNDSESALSHIGLSTPHTLFASVSRHHTLFSHQSLDTVHSFHIGLSTPYTLLASISHCHTLTLTQANSRVMNFRNAIATAALINVKTLLEKFKKPELVEDYIKSGLIYYGEIPFLYRVFEPSAVRSSVERGNYKVVSGFFPLSTEKLWLTFNQTRHGLFQNQAILDTVLIYYGKRGIKEYLPTTSSPGKNPVGTLALICTAVLSPKPSSPSTS